MSILYNMFAATSRHLPVSMVRLSKSDATMGRDSPDSVELVSEDDNGMSFVRTFFNVISDYEVEDIISHRKVRNNILYTVSWVGYKDENTEIAEEDLAVSFFLASIKLKEQSGRGVKSR